MFDYKLNCSAENMTITIEDYRHFADNISIYWGKDILKDEIDRIRELLKIQSILITNSGYQIGELTSQGFDELLIFIEEHNKQSQIIYERYLTKVKNG